MKRGSIYADRNRRFCIVMCDDLDGIHVVTMGGNGPRIHEVLAAVSREAGFALHAADDLSAAVAQARVALPAGGVILLSPGAPSFGAYKDYVARGRHFAELAGFDPGAISGIAGMGIA